MRASTNADGTIEFMSEFGWVRTDPHASEDDC